MITQIYYGEKSALENRVCFCVKILTALIKHLPPGCKHLAWCGLYIVHDFMTYLFFYSWVNASYLVLSVHIHNS